jgi:hypothetical protein
MILGTRFLLQFVRAVVNSPFEPVCPSVTGGRYAVLESEVATPSEHGAFNMLEKGRHWKNLPKEHTASVSVRALIPDLRRVFLPAFL